MLNKIRLAIPNAWYHKAWWLVLLLPFSMLYHVVMAVRQWLYAVGIKKTYRSPVPVMVVGNITVGGSGKTPTIITLVEYLQNTLGLDVGVISRGYGVKDDATQIVTQNSKASQVSDEPVLIVQRTHVLMAVGKNRQAAIALLLANATAQGKTLDLILSDDGLQHLALARDIEWVVLDVQKGLGNGWLLPAGPLRESPKRLKTLTVIAHGVEPSTVKSSAGKRNIKGSIDQPSTDKTQCCMHLEANAFWSIREAALKFANPSSIHHPKVGDTVYAVAGIGHPTRFFNTLKQMGFKVIEKPFPDHYQYRLQDFAQMTDHPIVTTEKDAVKLIELGIDGWALAVDAVLSANCYAILQQQLGSLGILHTYHTMLNDPVV